MSFQRLYKVTIERGGSIVFSEDDVRCIFQIDKSTSQQPNHGYIRLTNLSGDVENTLIKEGDKLKLQIGYEDEGFATVFEGELYQFPKSKEDGMTFALELFALDGNEFLNDGFISQTYAKGLTNRDISGILTGGTESNITDQLAEHHLPRGRVYFGMRKDYLRYLAKGNNTDFYIENGKVNMISAAETKNSTVIISPDTGLIGIPSVDAYGIDGYTRMYQHIALDSVVQVTVPGAADRMPIDGQYRITRLVYEGDTRGETWRTQFTGVAQPGELPAMAQTASEVF